MQARLVVTQDETLRKGFGARPKVLREQKNWAQKEPATQADIRFQQPNKKYESGLDIPTAKMLVELAGALGVTVDFLPTGNPVEDTPLFRRFEVLEALTADDREAVIELIDAMIAKERMAPALTPVDAPA